jgi:serine/threonine-protein kinase
MDGRPALDDAMASLDYQPGQLLPGTVYRILRLIGVGGMGTVYDVEDTTIGKRYVVKTLHPKLGAREDLARRVMKEARTLARLNHPNIIEVITAGVTADDYKLPFYVMERLNGQSLRMVIDKKGRLELSHAYHIGIDLLDALDHAHDKGLIHRDVKPDNIFLHRTSGGVTLTKLLDFGIVSVLDGGTSETAGRFLGTLRYAAPEQLRGENPTPKMDVYAAALVLYEIIAGHGPFDDQGDSAAIGAAHVNKLAPRLSSYVPVPKELDNLLAAALAKDPRLRPRDAFSFAASLRNLSRSLASTAAQETTAARTTLASVSGLVTEAPPSQAAAPVGGPSTGSRASTARPTSASAPAPQSATLVGMPVPTVGPVPQATTTAPDGFDRMAATRSIDTEVARVAPHGTESVQPPSAQSACGAGDGATAATVPSGPPYSVEGPEVPIDWPVPRPPPTSYDPQIHSIPSPPSATAAASRGGRSALLAAGVGGALLLVLAAGAAMRQVDPPVPAARIATPPTGTIPYPVEQHVVAAPILPPPAFDPGELPEPRPRAAPLEKSPAAPTASAEATPAPVPPKTTSATSGGGNAKPSPPRAHFAADRPGPGF